MNNPEIHSIDQLYIGFKKTFSKVIDEQLVDEFAKISGDFNPLHTNEEYAKKTKFKKRVVHGMLLASFFSKLIGMHIPGKKSLYMMQNLKFVHPVFINDQITIMGEIISKNEKLKLIMVSTIIRNQYQKICLSGEAKVLILD